MAAVVEAIHGRLEGLQEEGLQSFRGIPFAKPPVGPLRFAAPESPEPWSGVRSAREFGPSASQCGGDPNHADLPDWAPYDADRRTTLIFDREPGVSLAPFDEERSAWDGLF